MGLADIIKPQSYFPQTRAIDKSQQHQNNFLGVLRIEPTAAGLEVRMLTLYNAVPKILCYFKAPCIRPNIYWSTVGTLANKILNNKGVDHQNPFENQ